MRILVAYGTRPEKIKLEPVVRALKERGATVDEWYTGQSPDLTGHAGERPWDSLTEGVADCLRQMARGGPEDDARRPQAVVVQGDTATAFACALGAFLQGIPVAHVEAGLRTYADEPWPEEAFRRAITPFARWHFAPDADAVENLTFEGVDPAKIFLVGNPIIDTLPPEPFSVLVTLHRRENWGDRILNALTTLRAFSETPGVYVQVISHPNWEAQGLLRKIKLETTGPDGKLHWKVLAPQPSERFRVMLRHAAVVVTDSGGLQEEAAYYGVPCLVLRTATERTALEANGAITLVHPDQPHELRQALDALLARRTAYGTGNAGARIADILLKELGHAASD